MKLLLLTYLVSLFAIVAFAAAPQRAVIVTFPDQTPDTVVYQAMDAIIATGGVITHEYKLLKGFAAKASAKALETVTALGDKYIPLIEEDSMVSIDGSIVGEKLRN